MRERQLKGLYVCYGEMEFTLSEPTQIDDGGLGWRVKIETADAVVPMKFLRERDAEMAMHAIADLLDWTMDGEAVAQAIQPLIGTMRRLMTESLQW